MFKGMIYILDIFADFFPKEKLGRALSVYQSGAFFGVGFALIFGGLAIQFAKGAESIALPLVGSVKPWQMAFIMHMQFAEDLTDRQTAEQVRARIDWKCALGLELGEVRVSHLVDAFGRFLEAVTGGYHLESRAQPSRKPGRGKPYGLSGR